MKRRDFLTLAAEATTLSFMAVPVLTVPLLAVPRPAFAAMGGVAYTPSLLASIWPQAKPYFCILRKV